MTHTLKLTLEVEVRDLSDDERAECAEMCQISVAELPSIKHYTDEELAQEFMDALRFDYGGSNFYGKFKALDITNS